MEMLVCESDSSKPISFTDEEIKHLNNEELVGLLEATVVGIDYRISCFVRSSSWSFLDEIGMLNLGRKALQKETLHRLKKVRERL